MPLIGDTVRLKAEFRDFDGEYVDPDEVKVKLFDGGKKQLGEDITPDRVDTGKYQCDYVVPSGGPGPLYFEFSGMIGGMPVVGRATIAREWARG